MISADDILGTEGFRRVVRLLVVRFLAVVRFLVVRFLVAFFLARFFFGQRPSVDAARLHVFFLFFFTRLRPVLLQLLRDLPALRQRFLVTFFFFLAIVFLLGPGFTTVTLMNQNSKPQQPYRKKRRNYRHQRSDRGLHGKIFFALRATKGFSLSPIS
jgi:hypothetical protein